MKIKKNDQVKILAGKDKGKTGKVLQIFPKFNRASVEGVNILIKHLRPQRKGEKGQRVEFPSPIHVSNLMLICPNCQKATRISHKVISVKDSESRTTKTKTRACKQCKEVIK